MSKLRWLTAGESHGLGLLGILDGVPAGLEVSAEMINEQLARRQKGHGRGKRMEIEQDKAILYAGVRHGASIGAPIGLIIQNKDAANWETHMSAAPTDDPRAKITLPRPGHADLAGVKKYGTDDIRNILERASARETAMRVGLGSIARSLLLEVGITVGSRVVAIGNVTDKTPVPSGISPEELNRLADESPVRCIDGTVGTEMTALIDEVHAAGDSIGGIFEVIATGAPYGLGSHRQWDVKLKAKLTAAVASVNAIEGVEMGLGFAGAQTLGSDFHDEIIPGNEGRLDRPTNNAGGIEGGMSNSQPIVVRAIMKPIPTLITPLRSVDLKTGEPGMAHKERTDTCAVPAASIVAESMVCLELADAILDKFGGDSIEQLKAHMAASAEY